MIKFFRKIRQKLLSENKLSKYLIYASGEIVLVMIGILLALQVNKIYNESNRKKAEQVTINQLINDLSQSQYDLEMQVGFNESRARRYAQILQTFWMNELPEGVENLIGGSGSNVYSPILGTARSLINSGRLDILSSQELKNEIVSYVEVVGYTLKDINRYEESYFRTGTSLMLDIIPTTIESKSVLNESKDIRENSYQYKKNYNSIPAEVDKVPFRKDYKELFNNEKFYLANTKLHLYHRNISYRYVELLEITNQLLLKLYQKSKAHSNQAELLKGSEHYVLFEQTDLQIMKRIDSLLSSPSKWNKSTSRDCDEEGYNLYCAYEQAEIEVLGDNQTDQWTPARRLLLKKIEKYNNRRIVHRGLVDWNNHPDTTFDELKMVIKECIEAIEYQLNNIK